MLQYPDFRQPFISTTDASNITLGAVLSQGEVEKDLPIAFASRALTDAEIRYSTTERELLAIVWAVNPFRPILYGVKFKILTDHDPLTSAMKMNDPGSRLMKLRLKLGYKADKQNGNADALSKIYKISSDITQYENFVEHCKNTIIINQTVKDKINYNLKNNSETTLAVLTSRQIIQKNTLIDTIDLEFNLTNNIANCEIGETVRCGNGENFIFALECSEFLTTTLTLKIFDQEFCN